MGFWSAVGDALLMFPLTRAVRESLIQLACASMAQHGGSAAAAIRGRWGLSARPEECAVITGAPVVGILLQLLLGCDEAQERSATLEALHSLIGDTGFTAVCILWHPPSIWSPASVILTQSCWYTVVHWSDWTRGLCQGCLPLSWTLCECLVRCCLSAERPDVPQWLGRRRTEQPSWRRRAGRTGCWSCCWSARPAFLAPMSGRGSTSCPTHENRVARVFNNIQKAL